MPAAGLACGTATLLSLTFTGVTALSEELAGKTFSTIGDFPSCVVDFGVNCSRFCPSFLSFASTCPKLLETTGA